MYCYVSFNLIWEDKIIPDKHDWVLVCDKTLR